MDPNSVSTLPSPSPSIKDLRQSCTAHSSPDVSELAGLVTAYKLSPKQAMQSPCTAAAATAAMNPTCYDSQGIRQFATEITQTQGQNNRQRPSAEPQDDPAWTSMQTQSGSGDLEHYTFHSSPTTTNGYPHGSLPGRSSPRSGNSPSYYSPVSWPAAIGDGSLPSTSFPSRECIPAPTKETITYYYSSAPLPSLSTAHFSSQSFDGSETNLSTRSHPDPYQDHHYNSPPSEGAASMVEDGQSSSPCRSTMMFSTSEDILSPGPSSEPGDDFSESQFMHQSVKVQDENPVGSPNSIGSHQRTGSGSPINVSNMKNAPANAEEPYAQLIYRALMSTKPKYAMTLQDIYQWFRDNTDKGKSDNKGWQNSIRHNLSMNQAFTKIERRSSTSNGSEETNTGSSRPGPAEICLSMDSNNSSGSGESKKCTKWYLQPWAITEGVQSTTRYRKGNSSRRGGANSRGATDAASRRPLAYAAARAVSGRKGGIRRFKARQDAIRLHHQQQQQQAAVNHGTGSLQMHHYHPQLQFQSLQQQQQQQQQHHNQRQRQHHFMRNVMNGQYTNYLPAMSVPPGMDFDFSSSPTSSTNNNLSTTADLQLTTGYPPPLLHHNHQQQQHSSQQSMSYQRAPSEPTIDEPLTPEPPAFHPLKGGEPPSHLLPLHRLAGAASCASTTTTNTTPSTTGAAAAAAAAFHHHHYSLHHPGTVNVVSVYDDAAERYSHGHPHAHGAAVGWGSGGASTTAGGGGGGVPASVPASDGLPYGPY